MIAPINRDLNAIKKKLEAKRVQKPNLVTGDPVFDAVTELFDGKVGDPYKEDKYKEICKKGKERYDAKIPPGYMDRSNNPNDTDQYGDFVLWCQLLDYSKMEARPIILITDDAKEDWWLEVRGEKLGPRPELISEFIKETDDTKWLYMYSTEQFLKYSKKYLDADVRPEVIKEAEGIKNRDVEQEKIRMTAVDLQEAQENYAAVEAALAKSVIPNEELRRAWAQTAQSAMQAAQSAIPSWAQAAQSVIPSEELRRAWAQAAQSATQVAQSAIPSEELRRASAPTAKSSHHKKAKKAAPNALPSEGDKQANQEYDGNADTKRSNPTPAQTDEKK